MDTITFDFDFMLFLNRKYVDAIGTADEPILLKTCSEFFEKRILRKGLANEYAQYCERRSDK